MDTDGLTLKSAVMMSRMPGSRASSRSGRSTRRMRRDLSGPSAGNISASRQTSETFTMKKSSTCRAKHREIGDLGQVPERSHR